MPDRLGEDLAGTRERRTVLAPTDAAVVLVANAGSAARDRPRVVDGRTRWWRGAEVPRWSAVPPPGELTDGAGGLAFTPSATGWCTGAATSARPWCSTPPSGPARCAHDPGPLHKPRTLAAHRRRERRRRTARSGVLRHRLPRHDAAGRLRYAVPQAWRDDLGVRRYGFHGLSHDYASPAGGGMGTGGGHRSCCTTSGRSAAAVRGGESIDTTMGFTPLEGLVMGTGQRRRGPGRCSARRAAPRPRPTVSDALNTRRGLLGLAGHATDMAEACARRAAAGDGDGPCSPWGTSTAAGGRGGHGRRLGGLDAVVFTGGIGEHAAEVRAAAGGGLGFLGVARTPRPTPTPAGRRRHRPGSAVRCWWSPPARRSPSPEACARSSPDRSGRRETVAMDPVTRDVPPARPAAFAAA